MNPPRPDKTKQVAGNTVGSSDPVGLGLLPASEEERLETEYFPGQSGVNQFGPQRIHDPSQTILPISGSLIS